MYKVEIHIKSMENGIIQQLITIIMKWECIMVWTWFHGKKTANGEIFDQNKISAHIEHSYALDS